MQPHPYCGVLSVESYIYNTNEELASELSNLFNTKSNNLSQRRNTGYQSTTPHGKPHLFTESPKLHKPPNENGLPPICPIVSHTNSILSNTAKLIDHILQPLAQSYPDHHLLNSTELVSKLAELKIQETITLVSMDVKNLYPSIPQLECLRSCTKN